MHPRCPVSGDGGKVLVSSKVTFPDSLVITVIFNIVQGDDNGYVAVLVWVESCGVFDVADVNSVLHNPLLGLQSVTSIL